MQDAITTKPMSPSEVGRLGALARWGKYRKSPQVARGIELSRQQAQAAGQRAVKPKPSTRPGGKKGGGGKGTNPEQQARQEQRDRERAEDRATRATDRQARITRQEQRDRERGQRATEGAAAKLRKEMEKREREQKRGGGGGGGGKDKKNEQAARDAQRRAERAAAVAERRADQRRRGQEQDRRERGRLEERNRRIQQRGTARVAAEQQKRVREAQRASERQQQAAQRRQEQEERSRVASPELAGAAQRLSAGQHVSEQDQQALIRNGLARRDRDGTLVLTGTGLRATRQKEAGSFAVFKDASGKLRWIARSTTAYRDRDGEIISTKALEDDATRMTATGQYGPLRYWHIGVPDPFDPIAPWGAGLDIGECDYSTVIGRTSIESGTFKSEAIGRAFAESAADYELSPGFFHPMDEPDVGGVYHAIRRFERSVVPVKYGRASNLFTGMAVKEHRMDQATYEARVKAYLADMNSKGVPPEVAAGELANMQQADKSAEQRGIAFKSQDTPPEEITINGVVYTVKATPEPLAAEAKADPPVELEVEAEPTGAEDGGQYIGDMTPAEFWAQLQQYLAPVLKVQELHKSLGDAVGEMRGMLGGYATKDAGRASEITALKEQQQKLAQRLKELEGDQPLVTLPTEVEAALKSAGPQAPPDPTQPVVPNDPERPFAPLSAALFPELYQQWQNGQ